MRDAMMPIRERNMTQNADYNAMMRPTLERDQYPQWISRIGRSIYLVAALAICMAGCVGDKGVAPALRPADSTLGSIIVSPLNVVMAVGDTFSVHFTARTLTGAALANVDSVEYQLQNPGDSLRIQVSSTGVVTARAPSLINTPVLLNILAFKDGLAAVDQSVIQVVATAFSGATLSIQPIPPDSAKMEWSDTKQIVPVIMNTSTGQSVASPVVRYEYGPGDSLIMQCYIPTVSATVTLSQSQLRLSNCGTNSNTGDVALNNIHANKKGTAWVHANVVVFGTLLRDSVQYTITNPYGAEIDIGATLLAAGAPTQLSANLAPGGTVVFYNNLNAQIGATVSVTLDHPELALPANPPSQYGGSFGNITGLTITHRQSNRIFATPGTYHWTATVSGGIAPYTGATATGTINVQ